MKLWGLAAASVAAIVGLTAAPTQTAQAAPTGPPNGGPVVVVGGSSPSHGRIGKGSGRVGTRFTLTPAKGGCPHTEDAPFVRWKAPYTEILIVSSLGSSTGYMPTGAPKPGLAAARPGTYSAQLECLTTTADHHTVVDKVFTPASITLTGNQLLPSLSRTSAPAGGTLGIALPGPCSGAVASASSFVNLAASDGRYVAELQPGNATIPSSVAPGRYFVTGGCDSSNATGGVPPGYAYGFKTLTVTR